MTTEYTRTITIACPESLFTEANHLACLMGESANDINTFNNAHWQDASGNKYGVIHTVVKPIFFSPLQTNELPATPDHGIGIVDRTLAQTAFDSMNSAGGILFAYDTDFNTKMTEWGITQIPVEEDI